MAASRAMRQRAARPSLGGVPFSGEIDDTPNNARTIIAGKTGYVQHIDMNALSNVAQAANGKIYLLATPGSFVDPAQSIVRMTGKKDEGEETEIRDAFTVDRDRSFDQDPEYGLAVLSEIASRALSPAINDPGTAIDIIGRAVRALLVLLDETEEASPRYPKVYAPRISAADLFDSFFTPVARDGAGIVEVQVRLQEAFAALARSGNDGFREQAQRHAKMALGRAEKGLVFKPDLDRVKKAASARA